MKKQKLFGGVVGASMLMTPVFAVAAPSAPAAVPATALCATAASFCRTDGKEIDLFGVSKFYRTGQPNLDRRGQYIAEHVNDSLLGSVLRHTEDLVSGRGWDDLDGIDSNADVLTKVAKPLLDRQSARVTSLPNYIVSMLPQRFDTVAPVLAVTDSSYQDPKYVKEILDERAGHSPLVPKFGYAVFARTTNGDNDKCEVVRFGDWGAKAKSALTASATGCADFIGAIKLHRLQEAQAKAQARMLKIIETRFQNVLNTAAGVIAPRQALSKEQQLQVLENKKLLAQATPRQQKYLLIAMGNPAVYQTLQPAAKDARSVALFKHDKQVVDQFMATAWSAVQNDPVQRDALVTALIGVTGAVVPPAPAPLAVVTGPTAVPLLASGLNIGQFALDQTKVAGFRVAAVIRASLPVKQPVAGAVPTPAAPAAVASASRGVAGLRRFAAAAQVVKKPTTAAARDNLFAAIEAVHMDSGLIAPRYAPEGFFDNHQPHVTAAVISNTFVTASHAATTPVANVAPAQSRALAGIQAMLENSSDHLKRFLYVAVTAPTHADSFHGYINRPAERAAAALVVRARADAIAKGNTDVLASLDHVIVEAHATRASAKPARSFALNGAQLRPSI